MKFKLHICFSALLETCSFCKKERVKSLSCVRLFATPWTVVYQASPSMGFFRQEYWSGVPFLSPGDLPDPGIEPGSPKLQADALPSEPPGNLYLFHFFLLVIYKSVLKKSIMTEIEITQKTQNRVYFSQNSQVSLFKTIWEAGGRRMDWELGVGRCY